MSEIVATFEHNGDPHEIDHLGIERPETQWGEYAIYCQGQQVGEFALPKSILKAEHRNNDLPPTDALIVLAYAALVDNATSDGKETER